MATYVKNLKFSIIPYLPEFIKMNVYEHLYNTQ